MKAYTEHRILLLCAFALLAACARQPVQPPDPAPAVSGEFRSEYEEALGMMRAQRYDQAGARLDGLTRSHPDLAGPHVNLGIAHLHLGHLREAEEALLAAIELNPRGAIAHNLLGVVYRGEGRFDDARRAYLQALEIDPAFADAHLNLGILYDLYLRRSADALTHYERYRALRPADAARVEPWIADLVRTDARLRAENGS